MDAIMFSVRSAKHLLIGEPLALAASAIHVTTTSVRAARPEQSATRGFVLH
jgi:hypothetical protein